MSARSARLLLGAACLSLLAGCGEEPPPTPSAGGGTPPARGFEEGFSFEVPGSRPTGEAFVVPRPAAAGTFRTRGTFSYERRVRGRLPPDLAVADRRLEGSIDVVRTTSSEGGRRGVTVVGTLEAREGSGAPVRSPFRLDLDEGPRGGAERRDVRLPGAAAALADALEEVTPHWAERLPLPDRPVRVGETFSVEALDVEPLQRSLWSAFLARDPALPGASAPIVGASWVVAREAEGGEDAVHVRSAARTQPLVLPLGKPGTPSRRLGYADALDRDRRVSLATGVTLAYDSTTRVRLRYVEEGADYTVDVERRASLRTTRAP